MNPNEAKQLIDQGAAPEGLVVEGALRWEKKSHVPQLPAKLTCYSLDLANHPISSLPEGLVVHFRLNLSGCAKLTRLPESLKAGSLDLSGCTELEALPKGLDVSFLDITGCTKLRDWPKSAQIRVGRLRARGCTSLKSLPDWLTSLSQLDISGCSGVSSFPRGLRISSWLDVADSGIRALPRAMAGTPLRWRGVPIDDRIAFRPQEITAREVLDEPNAELRRVKMERMGLDRFMTEARAQVLDEDTDAGGTRQLLRVPLEGDEDLVCVSVSCPSTGRRYIIRVPPQTRTCRQAVAWTAGFSNPDEYNPIVET